MVALPRSADRLAQGSPRCALLPEVAAERPRKPIPRAVRAAACRRTGGAARSRQRQHANRLAPARDDRRTPDLPRSQRVGNTGPACSRARHRPFPARQRGALRKAPTRFPSRTLSRRRAAPSHRRQRELDAEHGQIAGLVRHRRDVPCLAQCRRRCPQAARGRPTAGNSQGTRDDPRSAADRRGAFGSRRRQGDLAHSSAHQQRQPRSRQAECASHPIRRTGQAARGIARGAADTARISFGTHGIASPLLTARPAIAGQAPRSHCAIRCGRTTGRRAAGATSAQRLPAIRTVR